MDTPEPGPPAPPAAATCWRCGASVREGARFCGRCGMALNPDDFLAAPSPARRSRLGLGVALGTYFALLAAIAVQLVAPAASVQGTLLFDVVVLAVAVALVVVFWAELGPLLGPPSGLDARTVGLALGALGLTFAFVQGLALLLPDMFVDLMESYRAEGVGLAFALFQIGPITALGEELLFRGVILGGLERTFPRGAAIAVSAAMFATIHRSPLAFVHTGALGVVFAWLTLRTRSLWPSIVLHASWNIAMVLIDA